MAGAGIGDFRVVAWEVDKIDVGHNSRLLI